MRVTFCGTGGGGSINPDRANAAIHLHHEGADLLLDAGPGWMERLVRARLDPEAILAIVISHLHFDHAVGMLDLFTRLIRHSAPPPVIYGPRDTDRYLRAAVAFAHENAHHAGNHEWLDRLRVETTRPGDERELAGMRVRSVEVPHVTYLECLARRFEAGGRSFVYSGDTRNAPELIVPLSEGAGTLIHEAFTEAAVERLAAQRPPAAGTDLLSVFDSSHTRARDAAAIAREAGVRRLVLTHLVAQEREEELLDEARAAFSGEIVVAHDGLALEI